METMYHMHNLREARSGGEIFSFMGDYGSITRYLVGSGSKILFWKDFLIEGELLCDKFTRLFSFALNEDSSIEEMVNYNDLFSLFSLPLSVEVYDELQQVTQLLVYTTLENSAIDQTTFVWESMQYTLSKFYRFLF
jgi:hypothetical protein